MKVLRITVQILSILGLLIHVASGFSEESQNDANRDVTADDTDHMTHNLTGERCLKL